VKYGIRSIPTLLVFKGGQPVGEIIGFRPKSDLKKRLDAVVAAGTGQGARHEPRAQAGHGGGMKIATFKVELHQGDHSTSYDETAESWEDVAKRWVEKMAAAARAVHKEPSLIEASWKRLCTMQAHPSEATIRENMTLRNLPSEEFHFKQVNLLFSGDYFYVVGPTELFENV
jgi:hypothetical protein